MRRTLLCFQSLGWKSCRPSVCLGTLFLPRPCLAVEIQCKSCIPQVLPWDRGLNRLKLQTCAAFLHAAIEFPSWTFSETPKKASLVCSVSHNSLCRGYTLWSMHMGRCTKTLKVSSKKRRRYGWREFLYCSELQKGPDTFAWDTFALLQYNHSSLPVMKRGSKCTQCMQTVPGSWWG